MTWMPDLRRQLDRLEALQAERRHETGDRMGLAFGRMLDGVPNDEDIDLILDNPSDTWVIPLSLERCLESTATRDVQLRESPPFRLAADVYDADTDEERHQAMVALRRLANDGRYRLSVGHRTARPADIGLARVVLRFVVRNLERQATEEVQLDDS